MELQVRADPIRKFPVKRGSAAGFETLVVGAHSQSMPTTGFMVLKETKTYLELL